MAARKATSPRKTTPAKSSTKARTKSTAKSATKAKAGVKAAPASKVAAKAGAAKPTTARKSVAKTVTPKVAPQAKPAMQGVSLQESSALSKKQLIEDVVARSGIKKKDAKPVIEAMLGVLGEAIAEGRDLNLQPFGKITLQKQNEKAQARVSVVRIRQPNHLKRKDAKDPLAQAAE